MKLFFKSSVLLNVKCCFFQSDLCGRGLKPLWRAVLKRRGSVERIHSLSGFNCVDGKKVKLRAEWLLFLGHLLPVQQSLQICHITRGRYESASTIGCLERTRIQLATLKYVQAFGIQHKACRTERRFRLALHQLIQPQSPPLLC